MEGRDGRTMHPASLANLKPNSERTRKQLQEMGRRGGIESGRRRKENRITITMKTMDGEHYTVTGATPEKAAEAMGALELELLKSWREVYGIPT